MLNMYNWQTRNDDETNLIAIGFKCGREESDSLFF
jgi:hypothetical protein